MPGGNGAEAGGSKAAPPVVITSLQNERIKAIRALEMRKTRKETGLFVAEGTSLLVTAREEGWMPETLAYLSAPGPAGQAGALHDAERSSDGSIVRGLISSAENAGAICLPVNEAVLAKIAAKDNPQSLIGVFKQRWIDAPRADSVGAAETWLALEEIRDPGNLGTIIRTADAAGVAGIILIGTCCDAYSRECVRASMGSIFSVPLASMSRDEFIGWCSGWAGDILGLHLSGAEDYRSGGWSEPVLVVMGSEGPGLSDALTKLCTRKVKIPMAGSLDSLNLAIATALTLYEVRRPHLKI